MCNSCPLNYISCQHENSDDGHCVWYGTDLDSHFNVVYNGTAKPLDDSFSTETLKSICPDLFVNIEGRFQLVLLVGR